jgi:hypothetical protein
MHPTGEEQLRAVCRRLELVAADPGLAPESVEALDDAVRQLRRLEGAWPARLPFLLADNEATAALLRDLGADLPAGLSAVERFGEGEERAHEMNKAVRECLAQAVRGLPSTTDGDAARTRIALHLRRRIAADPALNRRPRPYHDRITST